MKNDEKMEERSREEKIMEKETVFLIIALTIVNSFCIGLAVLYMTTEYGVPNGTMLSFFLVAILDCIFIKEFLLWMHECISNKINGNRGGKEKC